MIFLFLFFTYWQASSFALSLPPSLSASLHCKTWSSQQGPWEWRVSTPFSRAVCGRATASPPTRHHPAAVHLCVHSVPRSVHRCLFSWAPHLFQRILSLVACLSPEALAFASGCWFPRAGQVRAWQMHHHDFSLKKGIPSSGLVMARCGVLPLPALALLASCGSHARFFSDWFESRLLWTLLCEGPQVASPWAYCLTGFPLLSSRVCLEKSHFEIFLTNLHEFYFYYVYNLLKVLNFQYISLNLIVFSGRFTAYLRNMSW